MVNFKEFFESFASKCEHSSIIALIQKFRENAKNKSMPEQEKYLPVQIIFDCLQEHYIDDADLEKLSYYLKSPYTSRGTPNTMKEKDQGILYLLDKYEKASVFHGKPSFNLPYDPSKLTYFIFLFKRMPTEYVLIPEIRGDTDGLISAYGNKLDISLKIPVAPSYVQESSEKNQSIGDFIKSDKDFDDHVEQFFYMGWDVMEAEVYFSDMNRTVRSILLPNDELRKGLEITEFNEMFFASREITDAIYKSINNNDYIIINDTGVKHV